MKCQLLFLLLSSPWIKPCFSILWLQNLLHKLPSVLWRMPLPFFFTLTNSSRQGFMILSYIIINDGFKCKECEYLRSSPLADSDDEVLTLLRMLFLFSPMHEISKPRGKLHTCHFLCFTSLRYAEKTVFSSSQVHGHMKWCERHLFTVNGSSFLQLCLTFFPVFQAYWAFFHIKRETVLLKMSLSCLFLHTLRKLTEWAKYIFCGFVLPTLKWLDEWETRNYVTQWKVKNSFFLSYSKYCLFLSIGYLIISVRKYVNQFVSQARFWNNVLAISWWLHELDSFPLFHFPTLHYVRVH